MITKKHPRKWNTHCWSVWKQTSYCTPKCENQLNEPCDISHSLRRDISYSDIVSSHKWHQLDTLECTVYKRIWRTYFSRHPRELFDFLLLNFVIMPFFVSFGLWWKNFGPCSSVPVERDVSKIRAIWCTVTTTGTIATLVLCSGNEHCT